MAWLNVKKAASYSGISVTTLYRWHDLGLPKHKIGGRTLFSTDDIDEFIRKHTETGWKEKISSFVKGAR